MLISLFFKENGPANSVILYNDPIAISKQGQTLTFDCIEKNKWKRNTNLMAFAASVFLEVIYQHASEHKSEPGGVPLSWQLMVVFHVADSTSVTPRVTK